MADPTAAELEVPLTLRDRLLERVRRGAAWLDEAHPGWADRLKLSRLKMSDGTRCVLGQLFAAQAAAVSRWSTGFGWATAAGVLPDDPAALGFDVRSSDAPEALTLADLEVGYALLGELWADEVRARRTVVVA